MKKGDYIVILILLVFSGVIFRWTRTSYDTGGKDKILQVTIDGKIFETLNLNQVGEKKIHIDNQFGHNVILIDHGKVTMVESSCKDKICMKMGTITQPGESIICLPHHLVLTIVSKNKEDLDIIIK